MDFAPTPDSRSYLEKWDWNSDRQNLLCLSMMTTRPGHSPDAHQRHDGLALPDNREDRRRWGHFPTNFRSIFRFSISSSSSSSFGVSIIIGIFASRLSLTIFRNPSIPISPFPICS